MQVGRSRRLRLNCASNAINVLHPLYTLGLYVLPSMLNTLLQLYLKINLDEMPSIL